MSDKMQDVDGRIIRLLREGPMTPDEVAERLGIAWATAQGHLLKLTGEGKVSLARKGRVNVFYLKIVPILRFSTPSWVRAKSLEELSDELDAYFSEEPTAAEMVERERRKG